MNEFSKDDWTDYVEENIRSGLIELWILSMLTNKDMYTYEIKQELIKISGGTLQMRDGSMYGPMYRMLNRGLISSRQEIVGAKRFRNYYHIEETGREYLKYSVKKFYEVFGMTDTIISGSEMAKYKPAE